MATFPRSLWIYKYEYGKHFINRILNGSYILFTHVHSKRIVITSDRDEARIQLRLSFGALLLFFIYNSAAIDTIFNDSHSPFARTADTILLYYMLLLIALEAIIIPSYFSDDIMHSSMTTKREACSL